MATSTSTETWTLAKVAELIDLYELRPCLYQTNHKEYFNRDARSKALGEIAELIEMSGKSYDFDFIELLV